jgi:hypothetical protein
MPLLPWKFKHKCATGQRLNQSLISCGLQKLAYIWLKYCSLDIKQQSITLTIITRCYCPTYTPHMYFLFKHCPCSVDLWNWHWPSTFKIDITNLMKWFNKDTEPLPTHLCLNFHGSRGIKVSYVFSGFLHQ